MREFSVGDAILAGFRLIGREPLAFLAWTLVYAVVGLTPQVISMAMGLNVIAAIGPGSAPSPDSIAAAMAPLQRVQPISLISSAVAALLSYGAVYRAMLFPDDRRFLYLRLGPRELWLGLAFVALVLISAGGFLALMIPFFIVVFASSAAGAGAGAGVGAIVGLLLMLVAIGVFFWAWARLSLALPMGFAERNFRIQEAWRKSAGHAGRIVLVILGLMVMFVVLEGVLFGVGFALLSAVAPLGDLLREFGQNPARLITRVPPLAWAPVVLIWALFSTWAVTVFNAALAEIYKGLMGPVHADVFD